ncbi:SusD-like starch-binding protein associating with outer membrane [Larkinella arboricola]|uniref:SusD-like starch-binding protein associating with outer membrane n=1 Tax=Larkinella arboricola TaxID=643671 RepID=A0A327X7P8_LARAB|nr:SusD/RagB family nutrient-binding outer membrane lipoprotein [Larkinella arboricola]RAK02751.1 SusD-like starch-binding protein associating with outer membrane [Larkinella arboricola]
MNTIKALRIPLLAVMCLWLSACKEDLTEINQNPNSPENVSSNYILTYSLVNSGKLVFNLGRDGSKIAAAMQYMQAGTNEGAAEKNQYAWVQDGWGGYYDILRNVQIIYDNGVRDDNKLFQGIGLTMKSMLFGLLTDLYGDIPYSEALQASTGSFFPKYDKQADVYKGILTDLKQADQLLQNLTARDVVSATSDVMYKGDAAKWRKFANSLRLRYALRLADKKAEMAALGINLETEFKEAAASAFTSKADDATIAFLGTNSDNAQPGGPLATATPNRLTKPAKPLVDKLLQLNDPRLQRWANPVLRKWDANVKTETTKSVTNLFGETYSVVYVPSVATTADTNLYVGLPVGLPITQGIVYNKGNDVAVYPNERNPYISLTHDRYRNNNDPYVAMNFMNYPEVEFILAEAALLGGFGATDAEDHYKKAVQASMDKEGALAATGFKFDTYYAQPGVNYASAANKQERILEQKWISSWFSIQSWFDWRRTGYPALKTGPVAQFGAALPIRYMYPTPNLDPKYIANYNEAVERLGNTNFIPSGQSKDHHYAKMWLVQGTSKPW